MAVSRGTAPDLRAVRVDDVMSRRVTAVAPDTPVAHAAALLRALGVAALPVLDRDRQVVGVLAEVDLLHAPAGYGGTGGPPADGTAGHPVAPTRWRSGTVGAVMASPARCLAPGASASTAAEMLVQEHIRSAPVVFGGVLVGMVSRRDLLRRRIGRPRRR